jgi:hypothetical protein
MYLWSDEQITEELTGGIFFDDKGTFKSEFVEVVKSEIKRILFKKKMSIDEIHDLIRNRFPKI